MRIGMLADTYKPHISGVTNYIALNKKYLEKTGDEVFVFTFSDDDYIDDESNIIRSPGLPVVDTGFYLSLRYNKAAQKLLRTMDVVHVHHPFLSGSLALRYCKPYKVPIVFTNHTRYDLYAQAYFPKVPGGVGRTFLEAYLPTFCRACDLVISPSPGMRDVLIDFGVDTPVEVVPNGVDLEPFRHIDSPIDRKTFNFTNGEVLFAYVGRLGPEKNLSFLLRAFRGVVQAYENAGLILIGDGPEMDDLQDRVRHMGIASHVHFVGLIPYEEMPKYLKMADVFVTASFTEVHPLSVIEAMAAKLPVLGIDSPGVGDTVEDGKTGYLSTNDIAVFTAKMTRFITQSELRKQMSRNAQQAAEKYAIEHTTAMMAKHYQNITEHSNRQKRGIMARFSNMLNSFKR